MATTADAIILDALCARLDALTLASPLEVAWPNVDFDPPAEGYLAVNHFPAITDQVTLGDLGQNRHTGMFQVSVFVPEGDGSIAAMDVAGEIIAQFKRGTTLTSGGLSIRIIQPPYVAPMLQDPPFAQYPVTITYQADASNPS